MNKKQKIIKIILICLIALLLTKLVTDYLKGFDDTEVVVVAKVEIPERTVIDATMLEEIHIGYGEKARFFMNATSNKEGLIGQIAYQKIEKQHVFEADDKALVAPQEGLTTKDNQVNDPFFIGNEERLVKVTLNQTNGLGDVIKKGDFVDVTYTSKDNGTGGIYSAIILQHVFLYDVKPSGDKVDVLFKMKPEECLALTLGRDTGEIGLLLNPLEGSTQKIAPITPSAFFKGYESKVKK